MKILFICNQGRNWSRTTAGLFKNRFKTKSGGLYCDRPVTRQQPFWADIIVVMEELQRTEISKRFPDVYLQKRLLVLGILDIYRHDLPELIKALQSKMRDIILKKENKRL